MEKNEYSNKRTLVLSNACFSDSDSNGRTLKKLFSNYEAKNLAQFFTYGNPDFNTCDNYFRVTDKDALNSFLKAKETGSQIRKNPSSEVDICEGEVGNIKRIRKTPISLVIREIVWLLGRWYGKRLKKWIDDFAPEVILVFMADNTFLSRLALRVSKKYSIPIIMYTCENYVFKKHNYLTRRVSFLYTIFHLWLSFSYKILSERIYLGIFNTDFLADKYMEKFNFQYEVMYNSSDIDFVENYKLQKNVSISYLGNLGVGRHNALIELAYTLNEEFPGLKLDIYGKLPDDNEVSKSLRNCKYINYLGFISYENVTKVIHESTLLVHAEFNNTYYNRELEFAFSTKIADSVSSGTPLLLYANKNLAETRFLLDSKSAFVAIDNESLRIELNNALSNVESRKKVIENAKKVKDIYFSGSNNFKNILQKYGEF